MQHTNKQLAAQIEFAGPPAVLELLDRSRQLAEASDHLFNPATGQLAHLWGFHRDQIECREPPSEAEIQSLVTRDPRLSDIEINGFHLKSNNPAVQLDFGAISKGYGLDLAMARLRELGIESAIINAGGDLRAIGSRDGHPWRVPVRSPSGGGVFGFLEISGDLSVFTKGHYERNYTWDHNEYHDIIDPRTGYPAHHTAAVTVMHESAATADAAATALFIAGPKDWHRIARQMGVRHVLLIDATGLVHISPAMQAQFQLLDKGRVLVVSDPLGSEPQRTG